MRLHRIVSYLLDRVNRNRIKHFYEYLDIFLDLPPLLHFKWIKLIEEKNVHINLHRRGWTKVQQFKVALCVLFQREPLVFTALNV